MQRPEEGVQGLSLSFSLRELGGGGGRGGDGGGGGGWMVGWSVRRWMHRGGAIGSEARGTEPPAESDLTNQYLGFKGIGRPIIPD